jgi:hypothetical protein
MQMTKNLSKMMLFLGALVLVVLALVALRPVDGKVVAADPTATPTVAPTPTPVPFTGKADVVAMYPAMGVVNKDTGRAPGVTAPRSDDPTKTYAVFSPGTKNVPPGVPVYVQAGAISLADKATLKSFDWTLKAPDGSAAKIVKVDKPVPGVSADMATFTPDKEGEYVVGITATDSAGKKSAAGELKIVAAKYVGNEVCKGCHKDQYEGWSKTAHGTAFNRYVTMNVEAEYWTGGFSCARCHTVGYYPVAGTGGWWDTFVNTLKLTWNKGEFTVTTKGADGKDVQTKYNSIAEAIAFNGNPDFSAVDDKGNIVNGPVFGSMPAQLQAVSNIGCESCHGPAGAHVAKPSVDNAPMPSADGSSCVQCHNGGGHHTRGEAIQNSAHSQNAALEEGNRAGCNACHSAEGFVDVAAGKAPADARKIDSNIGCATCHDPHSEKNAFQLRKVNEVTIPVADGIEPTAKITDAGLSAVCMSCHNNRTNPNDAKAGVAVANPGPHYSSAAEQIAGVGGYTFGATIQNGFHSNIGKAPLTDEAGNALNGGAAPGACVLCHMQPSKSRVTRPLAVTPSTWSTKQPRLKALPSASSATLASPPSTSRSILTMMPMARKKAPRLR